MLPTAFKNYAKLKNDLPYIRISNLEGKALKPADPNGLSDPFIIFQSTFLDQDKPIKTSTQLKTLNPQWKDVIEIPCNILNRDYLESQHIVFQLMDYDVLVSNDPLGQAVLSLKGCFNNPTNFCLDVLSFGQHCGSISGQVNIVGMEHDSDE
jgi:Ca2+-dependent lipid-binding protein